MPEKLFAHIYASHHYCYELQNYRFITIIINFQSFLRKVLFEDPVTLDYLKSNFLTKVVFFTKSLHALKLTLFKRAIEDLL